MKKIMLSRVILAIGMMLVWGIYGVTLFVSSICSAASYPTSTTTPLATDLSMNQYKLKDVGDIITKGPWVDVRAFGAVPDDGLDDTPAIVAAINATPIGGTLKFFRGTYNVDPLLIDKPICIVGEGNTSATGGAVLVARGNQTHILKIRGNGVFPSNFIYGFSIRDLAFTANDGTARTISDAAVIFENCGMGRLYNVTISHILGRAIRFYDAQDIHFIFCYIADSGDNANQKPVIFYDPTSTNNCNNIYWIDCHFESLAWTLMEGTRTIDDQIQIIGGKNENRLTVNGSTITNLAFKLFNMSSTRFSCHALTMTETHHFSNPTFFLDGANPRVINCTVQNSSPQTSNFVELSSNTIGYVVRDNGGYNIGGVKNLSKKHGYIENTWWSNNSSGTNRRAILDATSPSIDRLTANAGGDIVFNETASLTGRSIAFSTVSDAIGGILLPIGYPEPIIVHFRVKASTNVTVSLGTRTESGNYTPRKTGISIGASFKNISIELTPANLTSAYEAVLLKETAGTDTVFLDGAWIEYGTGANDTILVQSAGTNIGRECNAGLFFMRHVTNGGSALVNVDTNYGVTIINQVGTNFTTSAPSGNKVKLSTAAGSGGRVQLVGSTAGGVSKNIGFKQSTAN